MLRRMAEVRRELSDNPTQLVAPPIDRAIAALAKRQHGVVSRAQLRAAALAEHQITYRVGAGRLHRLHRGVYAVGHTVLAPRGRWMAAVLACGSGAVLSHASAAALWELRPSAAELIHVSVPRAGGRRRPGLRIHRATSLRPSEVTTKDGIPITTPARTILDLAQKLRDARLNRLLDQAEIQRLTDYPTLDAMARAHPGHHGSGNLRAALATHLAGTAMTRSDLEDRFLALCRAHGLPKPHVNERLEGVEVDFLFAAQRLIVETDSWQFHHTRQAFERDRARDLTHAEAGYRTLRVTDRQLANEPHATAAAIARALEAATARAGAAP
jgi:very-short-patch-repair endonuclease